jgi:hypothetical protein
MYECPVAAAVWEWVAALWAHTANGQRPPLTARVLLLGDRSEWDPGGGDSRARWDILRLAAIFYLSRADSSAGAAQGGAAHARTAASATRIAARILAYIKRRLRQDFARSTLSARERSALDPSWLPGDRAVRVDFDARWGSGAGGCLCAVEGSSGDVGPGRLAVLLSSSHPAPVPQPV